MDINRAKQIFSSSSDIDVKYNGDSVWIEKINEDNGTANVHLRGSEQDKVEVEISELREVH